MTRIAARSRTCSRTRSRTRRLIAAAGLLAVLAVPIAGCSSSSDDSAESASVGGGADSSAGQGAPAPSPGDPGSGAAGTPANPATIPGEGRRIRTAQLTVEVPQLDTAATRVRAAATALGGFVAAESTGLGSDVEQPAYVQEDSADDATRSVSRYTSAGEAALVLRVPEPKAEELLTTIARTGTPLSRTTSAEDVTGAVADLDSRVASQTRSVARVRALLDRASSLQDVVMLEGEVAKRETELESLQARRASLTDRADLATVTAILRLPHVDPGEEDDADAIGFLDGLRGGWTALVASVSILLTILGALLPFAVAAALIGLPLLALLRRRRRPAPAPAAPAPAAPTTP